MSSSHTPANSYGEDGTFWRGKLAESLGLDPSVDDTTLGIAARTNGAWRDIAARVIGVNPGLSEADLLAAHDNHMAKVRKLRAADSTGSMIKDGTPPGPVSITANVRGAVPAAEESRRTLALVLINSRQRALLALHPSMSPHAAYDQAYQVARQEKPALFGY